MPALIFDCDGVLADTERDGHLPAFNATFEHFGLPVRWDVATYAEKVKIGGGKERMATLLTPAFVQEAGLPDDEAALKDVVAQWHAYKTAQYTTLIDSGVLPPRPGVSRLARAAHEAGWQLAVASTSARPSVEAVLAHAMGEELASRFTVFAGDVVPRKKPHPDIYELAIATLGVGTDEAVVVEDSSVGLRAALAAHLPVIVTVSGLTADEDFTGASLVVSSLGDDAEPATVLANPHGLEIADRVDFSSLAALLGRSAS